MKRAQAFVAGVAIVLVVACVALMVEAGRRIYHSLGPHRAVASSDGSLYVVSHGRLHIFGADGARHRSVDLDALGVNRKPSDIALHRDGRVVFADPDTSLLQRCRIPDGPCETLDLQLHRFDAQQLMPLNSIKLAIDDARQRYYVSDNAGHQIVIADFGGRVLSRSTPGMVRHPNHLFVSAPGELSVVDTDHHRIATFNVAVDRADTVLRSMATASRPLGRYDRILPFDATTLPDGRVAVLIANLHMADADLIVFDRFGRPAQSVKLGAASDPFGLELWNGRIMVADATHYRLQSFTLDGKADGAFPPREFLSELDRERATPERWRMIRVGAQVGLVAIPLLAIIALGRLGVPLTAPARAPIARPATGASSLPHGEIRWVAIDETFLKRQQRMFPFLLGMMLLIGATMIAIAGVSPPGPARTLVIAAMLLPILLGISFAFLIRRMARRLAEAKLGASAAGLHYALLSQLSSKIERAGPVAWTDVYFDGRRLLAGGKAVLLKMPMGQEMFPRAALESEILARIPPENFITVGALTSKSFAKLPPGVRALYVIICAAAIAYAAYLIVKELL